MAVLRRSHRLQKSSADTSSSGPARGDRKRTRAQSCLAAESEDKNGKSAKKSKIEEKKAVTAGVNAKRHEYEDARKRFLKFYQDLFLPLLPKSSGFMDYVGSTSELAVPRERLDEQPICVTGGRMKDYQLAGLSFLVWMWKNGMNCILGDEMGLGKTVQTLSLFAYIHEANTGVTDPHLVICPLSVLDSWMKEAAFWVPSFNFLRFHGSAPERAHVRNKFKETEATGIDVVVTTYECYVAESSWFKSRRWNYVVLDEGHKIKNHETDVSHELQGVRSLYRLILTGTPVHNNLVELWSLLHWLYPSIFRPASMQAFKDAFDLTAGKYSLKFLSAAQELLSLIMIRRTKSVVEATIPEKEELTVFVPLTEAQRFWYYKLLTRLEADELEEIFGFNKNDGDIKKEEERATLPIHVVADNRWKKLMNLLMQLRKVCDHPYMLSLPESYEIGEHVVETSSKLIAIDKILKKVLPQGERVLIFSQWTSMLDLLQDFTSLRGIPTARLDGSTSRAKRRLAIRLFQAEPSPYQVFLISTQAGGLGINLTKATTVIMCDTDWNPQNDLQAVARAHRIGQTKKVMVYRLICRGSVEDQMLDRIRRKLFLSLKVMSADPGASGVNEESNRLEAAALLDILRKGSSAADDVQGGMDLTTFLSAPIDQILDESRKLGGARDVKMKKELGAPNDVKQEEGVKKEEVHDNKDELLLQDAEEEQRLLLSGVAQVKSRLFEGQLIQRSEPRPSYKNISHDWETTKAQRQHVNRLVMYNGIESLVAQPNSSPVRAPKAQKPKEKEAEEWCICCRDGGELIICSVCPRVFHASCCGLTDAEAKRASILSCPQHACTVCERGAAASGGTLFRCQTCPRAFCDDCLPEEGETMYIGEELPEFTILGYKVTESAFFIRCEDCVKLFREEPETWADWETQFEEVENKLKELKA